jgi:chitodextrinase
LHVVTLTGLTPDTPYQFQVHASDSSGNSQVSSWMSFRTLLPPPDTTPPTVTITQPAGTVSGTVQIAATANDNVGVVGVQFKIDGAFFGPMDGTAPYGVAWDTRTAADGPHTITADAVDAMGNVGSASVQVTVNNTVPTGSPHYLEFDGANDYLEAGDSNALSFGNGAADTPLTFEMWIRPDALSGKYQLVSKWGETANQEYRLYIASNVIRLDLRDHSAQAVVSAYTTSSQAGLAGAWHHLAVTYDGRGGGTAAAGITIYVDGVAVPVTRINTAAYVAMENLGATLQIGRESAAWKQYDGGLDDLRLWNVARTLAQIQASRSIELAGTETGLVGYWRFNEGAGTTTGDGSPSGLTATLFNGVNWTAGGPLAPVGPDLTPPVITNIQTPNLTPTSVTVTFTTNETATGWVSYTAAPACPCTDLFGAGPTTAHTINLTGLTPQTTYQFQVKASDAAGNLRVGPNLSFQTPALPPDTTPPTVTITGPAAGNVMGVIQVTATAVDSTSAVAQVRFLIDGGTIATTLSPPYGTAWDTGTVPDGLHTVTVEAVDTFGNLGTASVIVNVRNTPVVTTPHFVEMDGVDDYVEIADGNAISFGNGASDTPFTIELWIRPDTMATKQQLVGKWGETSNQEYRLYTGGGTIRLDLRDNSTQATVSAYTGSVTALAGAWHHLAATYDGRGGATAAAGITIYIDGTAVALTRANSASYVAMENLGASLQVGHESTAWKQFDGGLDELRLWAVARSASQIQAARTTELTGAEVGLVGYWRFNEGSGTSSDDSSAGNLAATLNSGAFFGAGGPLTTP